MYKNKIAILIASTLMFSSVIAAEDVNMNTNENLSESLEENFEENYSDKYFYGEDLELTEQEMAALKVNKSWQKNTASTKPVIGPAGEVQFIFGGQSIDVVCAVLQICDIQLQPGEEVNSIHLGDGSRWKIEPALTGFGAAEIQHIVVKPLDIALKTNLLITTNRRTYHINLKSHKTELMPLISFVYPEDAVLKFKNIHTKKTQEIENKTIPQTREYLGNLNFDYQVKGDSNISWTPLRVYNDGQKTIIQLPDSASTDEIPSLLVLNKNSGKESLVNYRFINNRFIVDNVFKEAILISGVGSDQEKVSIKYQGNK